MDKGGTEKATLDLINHFNTDKYDVSLIKFFPGGEYNQNVNKKIKNKTRYPIMLFMKNSNKVQHKLKWWGRLLFERMPGKISHKYLIGSKYDIEIACGFYYPTIFISNSPKAKKISWIHMDYNIDKSPIGNFTKEEGQDFYSKIDRIVCVSKDCENGFNRKFGLPYKTQTIYNLIDKESISRKAEEFIPDFDKNIPTIVTVGRLTWQKGYDRLLEIHKELIEEGVQHKLYIIGEGEDYDSLKEYIDNNDLGETAILLGYKSNPYPYIKEADIIVCSSRHESFSLVVAEAIALEKPIVSTKCVGPIELLGNGEYGMLTDNDNNSLKKGIKCLLTNKEVVNRLETNVKVRKELLDKNVIIKQWEDLIDNLLK